MQRSTCLRRLLILLMVSCAYSSTARADIVTNLVGHWKFDEGSGTIASDSSGNGNTGTLQDAATWVTPGKVGAAALGFDGVSGYITAGQSSVLDTSTNVLTLAAWVRRGTTNADGFIVTRGTDGIGGYTLAIGGAGCSTDQIRLSKYYIAHLCLGNFPADTNWHHLAVVAGASGVVSYVDGVNVGSDPDTSDFVSASGATFYVGTYDSTVGFLNAQLDEVRVFARALSSSDIGELYAYTGGVGTTWTHEPSGFVQLTSQPWDTLASNGWFHLNRQSESRITTDAMAPLSPTNVLEHVYPTGFQGGGEPAVDWYPLSGFSEGFVGTWWKASNPWQGHSTGVNKIWFLFGGNDGNIIPVMYGPPGGPYHLSVAPEYLNWGWLHPNVNDVPITVGSWHKIELYFKQTGATLAVRWWMDDVLIGNYPSVPYSTYSPTEFQIAPTWGGVGDSKSENDFFRYDHVYISRPSGL